MAKKPTVKAPHVAPTTMVEPVKDTLPKVGEILAYHAADGHDWPMIVTRVNATDFDGQAFLDGTQRHAVEGATLGDGPGQCVKL